MNPVNLSVPVLLHEEQSSSCAEEALVRSPGNQYDAERSTQSSGCDDGKSHPTSYLMHLVVPSVAPDYC